MNNVALLGRVAGTVGKSAVSKAVQAANTLITQAKNPDSSDPLADVTSKEPLLDDEGRSDATKNWTGCTEADIHHLDNPSDPRDEVVTEEEYDHMVNLLAYTTLPDRGETTAIRTAWKEPRRFSVRVRNFTVENLTQHRYSSVFLRMRTPLFIPVALVFLSPVITLGGNLTEMRVRDPTTRKAVPKMAGYPGVVFSTGNLELSENGTTEFKFEKRTEWRGSYLHLEKENLTVELWRRRTFQLNELLAVYQEPLRTVVNTSVMKTATIENLSEKCGKKEHKDFFRIRFPLEFQEIYDYELNFCNIKFYQPHSDPLDTTMIQKHYGHNDHSF